MRATFGVRGWRAGLGAGAGVASAVLRYTLNNVQQHDIPLDNIGDITWEGDIPGAPANSAISYRIVATDSRSPHPLIACFVGMIDDQQSDPLHFRGRGEADHRFAVAKGSRANEVPMLGCDTILCTNYFQRPFVALRSGVLSLLDFLDDRLCVLPESQPGPKHCDK